MHLTRSHVMRHESSFAESLHPAVPNGHHVALTGSLSHGARWDTASCKPLSQLQSLGTLGVERYIRLIVWMDYPVILVFFDDSFIHCIICITHLSFCHLALATSVVQSVASKASSRGSAIGGCKPMWAVKGALFGNDAFV